MVLAAGATAVAVAAGLASGGAQRDRAITVVIKPGDDRSVHFVDAAPKSASGKPDHISPGDEILRTITLRNERGRRIGIRYDELTFTASGVGASSIDFLRSVFVFGDGRIFSEGLHGPKRGSADAVTGGTGAYAGARGTVTDVSPRDTKLTRLAIRLLP